MIPLLAAAGFFLALALPLAAGDSPAQTTPANVPAHDLLSQGRVDQAITLLQARKQTSPQDAEAHHLLCRAYFELERWDDATAAGQRAVALQPSNSDYHLWLGRAYGAKAEHSNFITAWSLARKVRSEFERAVALNSANVDARSDLAEFYLEAPSLLGGGKDKALAQAQQIAPMDAASAHWVQARLAEKDKHLDIAEKEYRAAIQSTSHPSGRWLDLAAFYRRAGRMNDMEEAINKAATAETRRSNVFFGAAELLVRAGRNFPAAAQLVRKYLASNSPVEEAPAFQAHYLLGSILEKQGDKRAAAAEYRAALALAKDYEQAQQGLRRVER